MKAFLKKYATWILCAVILLAALLMYIGQSMTGEEALQVTVYVDGKEYGVYSLTESQEILVQTPDGTNLLVIEDGEAYVREADCSSQVCVHTKAITGKGGQIICLPHKVVISAGSAKEGPVDAVTN